MKLGLSGLFKKKEKYSENHIVADPRLEKVKAVSGYKKRPQGPKKKMLPFFRKIRVGVVFLFSIVFAVSLLGFISFSTIGASLSKGSDATLPLNVREIKDEYMNIQESYSKFDFNTFKKLLGQNIKTADDDSWSGLAGAFFGTDHLKYMKSAVEKAGDRQFTPEEAGLQTPQINIMGMSMVNDHEMVIALNYNGRQETWLMEKKGNKWVSNSLPSEYMLGRVDPYGKDEVPYFEIVLRNTPEIKWKVQMANTAVKSGSRLGKVEGPGVTSEVDKMRTAGSYIMVKENGKVRYVNMAPKVEEAAPNTPRGKQPEGTGMNFQGDPNALPEEVRKIIENMPVEMPVTGPGGEKGKLKTTMNVEKRAMPEDVPQPQGISNIQMIQEPAPDGAAQPAVSE